MKHRSIVCFLLLLCATAFTKLYSQGTLVIVGGGLDNTNKEVFEEFIGLAGGTEAVVSVIPAASGVATQSFEYFKAGLIRYGLRADNIRLIPIAMEDDDSTLQINEAEWYNNAWSMQWADRVRSSTAVWFTGGDQSRIMRLMFDAEGKQSPVMKAVWEVYGQGGVIGGTSAGAAIMSDPMIANGTSLEAVQHGAVVLDIGQDTDLDQGMALTKGIGFFTQGIVDQHFHARARTGRLVTALKESGQRFGFGIDENTALVYFAKGNYIKVLGEAAVTIFDTKVTQFNEKSKLLAAKNIHIHYLEKGSQFFIEKEEVLPNESKTREFVHIDNKDIITLSSGVFTASNVGFNQLIFQLFYEADKTQVRNLQMIDSERGIEVVLSRYEGARLFYDDISENEDHTIVNVRMDINPVRVSTRVLEP